MLEFISSDIIYPINRPAVKNGLLILESGKVLEILPSITHLSESKRKLVKKYKGFLLPGFVNTHCHLELSNLKNKISKKTGIVKFIEKIQSLRNDNKNCINAIKNADELMYKNGIVAVGDISNSKLSFKCKEKSKLYYHTFIELFGLFPDNAKNILKKGCDLLSLLKKLKKNNIGNLTVHAPYSVSKVLFNDIVSSLDKNDIFSIHNQESEEENKLFRKNEGQFYEFFKRKGFENYLNFLPRTKFYNQGGKNSFESILNFLPRENNIILVHNTFTKKKDIELIKKNFNALFLCLCPNANLYIENRLPDIKLFYNSGIPVCLGTDSLASNNNLSILEEIKTIKRFFSDISFETLFEWATINGAIALQVCDKFGDFAKGKSPGIINIFFEDNFFDAKVKLLKEAKY